MFCLLVVSDFCVGLLVEFFNLMYMIIFVMGNVVFCFSVLFYLDVIGFILSGIFFLMIVEISVDWLLVF